MYNIDLHHMPHASHMMPIIMCNIEEKIITEEKVVADGMQLFRYLLNIETIRKSNYYKHHKKKKVMLTLTATWTLPWDVFYNYVLQRPCSNYICMSHSCSTQLNKKFETRKYIITIFCNCYGPTTVQSINAWLWMSNSVIIF